MQWGYVNEGVNWIARRGTTTASTANIALTRPVAKPAFAKVKRLHRWRHNTALVVSRNDTTVSATEAYDEHRSDGTCPGVSAEVLRERRNGGHWAS